MNEQQTGREKMTDNIEQYKNCLDGLTKDMPEEFFKLAQVFELSVFEPIHMEGKKDIYAAYLMNDAVESYFVFEQSVMTGSYKELECEQTASIVHDDNGYMLIVNQSGENRFTIRFTNLHMQTTCFDYGCMGHFWVKGQEQWRQLVYIIGTIYEKYDYLGETYCNKSEKELLRLVEFPPFRMWSPIHESLEEKYPATYEGVTCMERLAKKAKDTRYLWLVKLYRYFPNRILEKLLAMRLLRPKRQRLYETIWQEVQSASEVYPERDYGTRLNEEIRRKRKEIHVKMLEDGFEGTYPEYYKKRMQITVAEEHPFTVSMLEFENFVFRVHFMVSKCGKHVKIRKNCGFFRGLGRIGKVEKEEK